MTFFYEFDPTEVFTAGAIGQPGERVFYVQVLADGQIISAKCEKQQVAALAQYLRNLLSDLPPPQATETARNMELRSPVEQDFVLGTVGLGLDRSSGKVVVQLDEMQLLEEDDDFLDVPADDEVGRMRVFLTPAQAVAFCERAEQIVQAGREQCRWCGGPIDPSGHACPRFN
jgi:uncharacterized repeat protein (TIGR03847 family)